MVLYPPVFFLRQYIGKRYFLNGWAGFIASVTGAFYAFLKYAKLHEGAPAASRAGAARAAVGRRPRPVDRSGGMPGGRVLKRLCTHRYCSGASRTICSMQALTRAVSSSTSLLGTSSSGAPSRSA